MVQNGQLATTPTRAWSKDDGSSKQTASNYCHGRHETGIWLGFESPPGGAASEAAAEAAVEAAAEAAELAELDPRPRPAANVEQRGL